MWQAHEYISGMALPITSHRQWGGFPEIWALCRWQKSEAFVFGQVQEASGPVVRLLCPPIGNAGHATVCLMWVGGGHYDVCFVSADKLAALRPSVEATDLGGIR